jgi:hypothetical protein
MGRHHSLSEKYSPWFGRVVVILLITSGPTVVLAQSVDPGAASSQSQPCDGEPPSKDAPAGCSTPTAPPSPAAPSNPKRILGIIPNFTTTDDTFQNRGPLAPHQKFILAFDQTFDISAHVGNLLQAVVEQATGGIPHYTSVSFGKRFAAAEADQLTSCTFIYGVFPALLHADPRYFRRDEGSIASRVGYAVSRTFVSRNDAGAHVLNASQLAGQFAQSGLSNLYYPRQDRTVGATMKNWAIQLGYNSVFNLLKEFYPDLIAKFHHHAMTP